MTEIASPTSKVMNTTIDRIAESDEAVSRGIASVDSLETVRQAMNVVVQQCDAYFKTLPSTLGIMGQSYTHSLRYALEGEAEGITNTIREEFHQKESTKECQLMIFTKSDHELDDEIQNWGRWIQSHIELKVFASGISSDDSDGKPLFFGRRMKDVTFVLGSLWDGSAWTEMNGLMTSLPRTQEDDMSIAGSRWRKERERLSRVLLGNIKRVFDDNCTRKAELGEEEQVGEGEEKYSQNVIQAISSILEGILPKLSEEIMRTSQFAISSIDSENLWIPSILNTEIHLERLGNLIEIGMTVSMKQIFEGKWLTRRKILSTLNFKQITTGNWICLEEERRRLAEKSVGVLERGRVDGRLVNGLAGGNGS